MLLQMYIIQVEMDYFSIKLLYMYFPVVFNLIFIIFWALDCFAARFLFSAFGNALIFPIIMFFVARNLLVNSNISIVSIAVSMFLSITLGVIIQYATWGTKTGNLRNPDAETAIIIKAELFSGYIICAINTIVLIIIKMKQSY